jgi:hypothetical protein
VTQSRYYSSIAVKTTLSLSIDAAATQIQVASNSGFPSQFPFLIILEKDTANEEIVTATALVGANYTITRGVDGTSAKSHAIGATVEHGVAAIDFTDSRLHEGASASVHGIGAGNSVVGTGTTQTLTNKTLTSPTVASPTVTGTVSGSATYNNIVVASPTINSGVLGTNLAAGLYRITNLGDPLAAQDAVTKTWAETAMSSQLALAQTASANAATASANALSSQTAAANSATNAATASVNAATASANAATASANAATSASNAATSSANAATSATNAATSAANAATASANAATASANAAASASAAAASAASAATSFDDFDDRYLGQKSADPSLDNDGNALIVGALYFNTNSNVMKVYNGSTWQIVAPDTSALIAKDIVTTKGDLIVAVANASPTRLGVGQDLYVLTASSTAPAGVAWRENEAGFNAFLLMGA